MHNTVVVGIYIPFLLITILIFISELIKFFATRRNIMFAVMCFCVIGWFSFEILILLVVSIPESSFVFNIGLIFIGFTSPAMFLFLLRFYRMVPKNSPLIITLVCIIPAINAVVVLSSEHHTLIREIIVISRYPIRNVVNVWGPWFWVHTAYCYIMSLANLVTILIGHFHMPKFYRLSSTIMAFGIVLVLSGGLVALLGLMPVNMDPPVIAVSVAILFMHFALINNDQSIFVRFSRGQVFSHLDEYILVLGEKERVVDYNPGAYKWASSIGLNLDSCTLPGIMDALVQKEALIKESTDEKKGTDIDYADGEFRAVLNLRVHDMADEKENKTGSIAIFTDVTQNRELIERLEAKAGMDSLTGLANRMAFEGARKRLDAPEHLPLSVIVGDVNGLKEVNDALGHKYGDMMLRVVAGIIEDICPASGFVARIGGDEFIYLLPRTGPEGSQILIEQIKERVSETEGLPFAVSIALGTAAKHSMDENLDDVITRADSGMYRDKRIIKGNVY